MIVEGRPHSGIITSPLVPPSFDTCQEAQMVKNLPAMQVTQFRSLGQGDPLEKGMAIHSSSLAWRIPWTEKTVDYSLWGCKELDKTK